MSWGIVFRLRQQLKGSLYALPVLGALLGPVLGQLTLWLDGSVQLPEAWSYSAATATAVLSVLVGSMVALLGFVVTIGVLVVQMATGTLSPRYMRLWYRDLLQKVVLATLAGTLTFSFSLLRHVEDTSVPTVDGRRERPPGQRRPRPATPRLNQPLHPIGRMPPPGCRDWMMGQVEKSEIDQEFEPAGEAR
jgi:hypothetical protein